VPRPGSAWDLRKNCINTSIEVGKYLVSPLTKCLHDGRYAASVSIRSGRGSATHDRVMRFLPLFDTSRAALRYATDQGMAWVGALGAPCTPLASIPETFAWPRKN